MSTHNICFHQEIRKILCGYPLLSVAMKFCYKNMALDKMLFLQQIDGLISP